MAPPQTPTIGTLRDRHLSLMREWRELESDQLRSARARELRQVAVDAGGSIEAPAERDEGQGIVDYWASAIAGLPGETYPDLLELAPYVPTQAEQAGRSLREAYEALAPAEAQRLARSILEDLLVLGENGVERDRPLSRRALQRSASTDDGELFDRVLDQLVETGAIVCRPSDKRDDDCFEVVDGRVAEAWPALTTWLERSRNYNSELARLMEAAQRWSAEGERADLLILSGSAVDQAAEYKGKDELLDRYIETSRRARVRGRRLVQLLSFVALIVLGVALYYYVDLAKQMEVAAEKALADRDAARKELAAATQANKEAQANADAAASPDALDQSELEEIVQGVLPSVNPANGVLDGIPALTGAMWLGSDKTPQVSEANGGQVRSFAQARTGTRYRAKVDIFLREAMPVSDANYASPKDKAVIPAGAQIVLLGTPRAYKRSLGLQYWANVRIVPQVYVQYSNASTGEIDQVRERLARAGFEVPPAELIRDYRGSAQVRYFKPQDRPIAAALQKALNDIRPIASRGGVNCQSLAGSRYVGSNFKLEFWFDGSRRPADGETPDGQCK